MDLTAHMMVLNKRNSKIKFKAGLGELRHLEQPTLPCHAEVHRQTLPKHQSDTIHPSLDQQCAGNMATLGNKQTFSDALCTPTSTHTFQNDRHALYTHMHTHSTQCRLVHTQQSVFCTRCVSHGCLYAHIHKAVSSGIWVFKC